MTKTFVLWLAVTAGAVVVNGALGLPLWACFITGAVAGGGSMLVAVGRGWMLR